VLPERTRKLLLGALGLWIVAQAIVVWPAIGAWRDEESRLRRIAAVRPRDPDALLGLADLLSTQGRAEEARAWIVQASRVTRDSVGALVALASLEYRAGRLDAARDAAERALAGSPRDLAAGVIRVRALARLGRHAEAVAAGESLVAQHPGDAAAEGALGAALAAAGEPARALPLLARSSARLLDDAGLAWDLGRTALASGDPARAREAFERVTRAEPGLLEGWLALADACHRLGDQPAALAALARAEGLGGNDPRWDALRARIRGQ
jgi:tetratricopeptide (TPR) repeat protein